MDPRWGSTIYTIGIFFRTRVAAHSTTMAGSLSEFSKHADELRIINCDTQ